MEIDVASLLIVRYQVTIFFLLWIRHEDFPLRDQEVQKNLTATRMLSNWFVKFKAANFKTIYF